jgi:uncharacterized protein YhbP (UPF0306 family)
MDPKMVAKKYLSEAKAMQIATLHDGRPRVNSVYFVASDDNRTLYWISEPRRRHSQDIAVNTSVGGAIAVKIDQPVAGLQFTGIASEVTDLAEVKESARLYSDKYDGLGGQLYDRLVAGTNKNRLYKVVIDTLELFDDVHFPGDEVVIVPPG